MLYIPVAALFAPCQVWRYIQTVTIKQKGGKAMNKLNELEFANLAPEDLNRIKNLEKELNFQEEYLIALKKSNI
jgi:hypothetical protein